MKKLLLASLAGFALASGSASAADMAAPVYKAPAPMAPATSWTGFYLDAGGGYALWDADTHTNLTSGPCDLCTTQSQGGKGWLGRVGGGFDYQLNSLIVVGALADYDFSSLSGTIQDQNPFFAGRIKENWSWAAGARIGLLATPTVLSYVNGGYTQTHFDSAAMIDTTTNTNSGFSTPGFEEGGWFLGGGVEMPLSLVLPAGWFLRTEYRYSYYGTHNLSDTCGGVSGSAACDHTFSPQDNISFHPTDQSIVTEVVYHFNWTGPVGARY